MSNNEATLGGRTYRSYYKKSWGNKPNGSDTSSGESISKRSQLEVKETPKTHTNRNLSQNQFKRASRVVSSELDARDARAARFSKQQKEINSQYGFVSRGEDSRLQRSSTERANYFKDILQQFVSYCKCNPTTVLGPRAEDYEEKLEDNAAEQPPNIDSILQSLRKLREALLKIPPDQFTKKVYLFSIRLAAAVGHYQTYVPSITYMLESGSLNHEENDELATLLVLHVSHFNRDNCQALKYYFKYMPRSRTFQILKCWIHQDFFGWAKLYNSESDNCRARIMAFGLPVIVKSMVKALTASFFNYDWIHLQSNLPRGVDWDTLVKEYKVTWERKDSNIILRERPTKR